MQKIEILFEDENLKIINKPAGVLAYPLPGSDEKTVGDMVGAKPCHRLDRDTSGILILAKNDEAHQKIQAIFKARKITKKYKTLVWGKVEPEEGEINIPLGRGSKDRLKVVPKKDGRESRTQYIVEKYFPNSDMSLCDINLLTGRTHQIRVHFSAIGHPVVGDQKYSNKKTDLSRQFLHAYHVEFVSPFTGKAIKVESDLPTELKEYLIDL
jgi:23S rRNA pseudouridine1911/1915/1917 synthase